jgi:hypothetical protein
MFIRADSFGAVESGNRPTEYEDAYWPERFIAQKIEAECFFAVADGASDALFSGLWANMLVKAYGEERLKEFRDNKLPENFEQLQREWRKQVEQRIVQPLPLHYEEKLRDGAFSTLIGLTIKPFSSDEIETGKWEAVALGDSCLFHVQDNQCLFAFPLQYTEQFNITPPLIPSNARFNSRIISDVRSIGGHCRTNDEFYLMTDALACWFLRERECGQARLDIALMEIRQLQTPNDFEQWIIKLRQERVLRNDDVTLLRIKLGE